MIKNLGYLKRGVRCDVSLQGPMVRDQDLDLCNVALLIRGLVEDFASIIDPRL